MLDSDSEHELKSVSKQDKPPEKKAAVEEDVNSSKITLGYLDKAEAVCQVTLLDGTSRSFKPFKGHDGFLRVKMFGKLKVLDAPNILLDIPKCKDEKGKVLKRPSIMKRPSQMPSSQDAVRDELAMVQVAPSLQELPQQLPKATPKNWTCVLYSKTGKEAIRRTFGERR